jgi:hypothetical protein
MPYGPAKSKMVAIVVVLDHLLNREQRGTDQLMSADKNDQNPELPARKMRRSLAALDGTAPDTETSVDTPADEAETTINETAETGGPKGPEPTRYGDWERKGRCIDF